MPRYLPPLNALRAFEAAGRHQSFSKSADELNVSHAAVSRHVRGLEKRLGVQLFKNIARGVELTEAGRRYLENITPAFDHISEATETVRHRADGTLSISCEPTFAIKWLMPRLGEFQKLFPETEVTLVTETRFADVANNEFDVGIRCCSKGSDHLGFDVISTAPYYPYASLEHPAPEAPEEFLEYPLLHWDTGQVWNNWFLEAGVAGVNLHRSPRPFNSTLAIEGAIAGQGVVLASPELVVNEVESGRLRRLSAIGSRFKGYFLVYSKGARRRKSVEAFCRWFIDETVMFRD
jgi:DNA-binding transcriptional LysR family regulator